MSSLTRRAALKTTGALIVSFAFDPREASPQGAIPTARTLLDVQQVDSFLAIHPDGRVTIFTSKVDVGTGMRIAIAQMAAEELGIPVSRISLVDGDTGRCPNNGGTGGSTGLTRGGTAVRQAAASARQELLRLASQRLGIPAADSDDRQRRGAPGPLVQRSAAGPDTAADSDRPPARARPLRSPRRSEGAARRSVQLHRRRHLTATARRSREVHRAVHLHPGSCRAGHAPRARPAPAGDWRAARVRGRELCRPSARRSRRPPGQLPRRGGEERVGGGPGCA